MTELGLLLRDEIARGGPISFHRFMDAALYHPELGYYRRGNPDPFGKDGDFFTAEQLQPAFGILIAARIRSLFREMGEPADFTVVELGAGRTEMKEALSEFRYEAIDIESGVLPESFRGVVFSNEFFDALPVHRVVWVDSKPRESLVDCRDDRFIWTVGDPTTEFVRDYVERYFPDCPDRTSAEVNLDALEWVDRISGRLESGYVLTIDYGYTARESKRFPDGTLMTYRRHAASPDVFADPGQRDITAHVCFTALEDRAKTHGFRPAMLESLSRIEERARESDQFASVLAGGDERSRRLQLKTLLFGMGETFRTLLQQK